MTENPGTVDPTSQNPDIPVSEGTEDPALPVAPVVRRVGPGQSGAAPGEFSTALAADSYFAANLLTLWHKVSEAGGAVGFAPGADRVVIAPSAARSVSDVRDGVLKAIAVTSGRQLVATAFLQGGRPDGVVAHTGEITRVMVDPDLQGTGLGRLLMESVLQLAAEIGLERVSLSVRAGLGLEEFYAKFGFTEYGRRPGWLRVGPDDDRDEILLWSPTGTQ